MAQSHSQETEAVEEQVEDQHEDQAEAQVEEQVQDQPEEPETDENQFARLMAERSAKKEGREPEREEPEPEPEPEPEQEEPEQEEPETQDHSDFASWPQAARGEVTRLQQYTEQLQRQYSAVQGRLAPMQRLVEDLRKQLHEKESAPPPTLKDLEENDAYKEIAQEFPDEAESIKKVFGSQSQVLEQAAQQQQRLQQALEAERRERVSTELQRLQVRYPNYQAIRNHPLFGQWRQARPEYESRLNTLNSDLVSEALDQFRRDLAQVDNAAFASLFPTAQRPAQAKPNRPKPPKPSPPSQGSGMSGAQRSSAPMTAEQAFTEYLAKKRRS